MKTLPIYIFLSFPVTLVLYIILFNNDIRYTEEVIINSNIEDVIKIHEDTTFMKKYTNGLISYKLISGDLRNIGAKSEIKVLFNSKDQVGKTVTLKEDILVNNLPNEKIIVLSNRGIRNTIKYRFVKMSQNQTMFVREHEYVFSAYMKVSAFLLPNAFKRSSKQYLKNFKEFVENKSDQI